MPARRGKAPLDQSVDVGFDPTIGLDDTRVVTEVGPSDEGTATSAYAARDVLPEGRVVAGRYRLASVIGRGGFGEVWRAHDRIFGEDVAVKLQKLTEAREDWSRREVATLGLLQLPGVCGLRDEGVEEGLRFVVMDLIDGRPFPGFETDGDGTDVAWDWHDLAPATLSFLDALGRVHAYGVVHRDLKPENVLVDDEGHATLLDFGVAFNPDLDSYADRRSAGTPRYLSPEQVRGRGGDPRSDLYAVGVMLFNALSGRWPHEATDRDTLFRRKLSQPARPLRTAAPNVPERVAEVVDRLLQFRASDRPASVAELIAELEGTHYVDPIESLTAVDVLGDHAEPADLTRIFVGSDRLTRIPTDAANELYRRTQGAPDRVRSELAAWIRSRLARVEDGRILIERGALDRLHAGLRVAPRARVEGAEGLPDGALVTAVGLADGQLGAAELATVIQRPLDDVVAVVDELVRRGVADRYGDTARLHEPDGVSRRDDAGRVSAVLIAGLPRHDLRRLRIAIAAGASGEVRETALDVAEAALARNDDLTARAAARVGVDLTLRGDDGQLAKALRYVLCFGWANEDSIKAHETAIYLAQQERGELDPRWTAFVPAVRASIIANRRGGAQALQVLSESRPTGDEACDAMRLGIGIGIANRVALGRADEVLRLVEPTVEGINVERARAAWHARRAYREARYDVAAMWYERAASHTVDGRDNAIHLTNAASAALEAEDFEMARRLVDRAREALGNATMWNVLLACRMEWLDRSIAYRNRRWGAPERELAEAASVSGVGWLSALIAFTEAGMAARVGDLDVAGELAELSYDICRATNMEIPLAIASCASAAFGREVNLHAAIDAIESERLPPLIEAQCIRLLQDVGALGPQWTERVDALCTKLGARDETVRELLTIAECRGAPLAWG